MDIRDSTTYWAIREEGAIAEARRTLLRFGQRKYGSASEGIAAAVRAITALDRLHRMQDQFSEFSTWDELLAMP